ncbi:MAG TPA: DUF3667 domain-containing protein [Phnomibacter sp.]|nr:DUF3667 domain-containing protein [Phnomibacter sp.]
MAHGKFRHQTNCLNCGAEVQGPYCHLCGQPNTEPKESLTALLQHFVYDVTHFDSKFFSTIRNLLLRPGLLTREYLRGRRMAYVNPVKMYIFTSAAFFLLTYIVAPAPKGLENSKELTELLEKRNRLATDQARAANMEVKRAYEDSIYQVDSLLIAIEASGMAAKIEVVDSATRMKLKPELTDKQKFINFGDNQFTTVDQYLKHQEALPKAKRDGWLQKYLSTQSLRVNEKYKGRQKEFAAAFTDYFLHSLPKLMLIALPLLALVLYLLYFRHRQHFNFVAHSINVLHLFIAIYLFIAILYGLKALGGLTHWALFTWLGVALNLYMFYYTYRCLRVVYQQKTGKTLLKFGLFLVGSFVIFMLLTGVFVINAMLAI